MGNGRGEVASELERELDSWVRSLRARRRSASTVAAYRSDVELLARRTGARSLAEVTSDCVDLFLHGQVSDGCAPATVERRRRSLRLFFEWCSSRGSITINPVRDQCPSGITSEERTPAMDELAALLGSCRAAPERTDEARAANRRDIAILILLMTTGARASELVGLDVDDVDLECDRVRLGAGPSRRTIDLLHVPTRAVADYVLVRDAASAPATPALFLGARGRLTSSGLRQMLERRCASAGVRHLRPHDFRRSVAADAARRGMSEREISAMLGWKTTRMARTYTDSTAE